MTNMFYRFYLSLVAFFSFQAISNLESMMNKIWFSIKLMKELEEKINFIEIKKKEVKKREVCRMFVLTNRCKFDTNCMFLHTKDPEIIRMTICKFRTECRKIHCQFGHEVEMNMLNEENNVSDDNCGICWENIYTYKKRFGLLSNCDHKFCIACIRKHRQNIQLPKINRSKCPLCRVPSFGYCSSKFFLTGVNKQNEFDKSSQNRAKIMCRNGFDCRKQYCGFKHSI